MTEQTKSVGLLVCDHVHKDLETIHRNYPQMFGKLLPDLDLTPYWVCDNQFPKHVDQHDTYICTGSKASVYDKEDWILNLEQFVRSVYEHGLQFIGICFGHQMIAQALGGKVEKASVGWCIGVHEFQVVDTEIWMKPFASETNFLMLCQDQVMDLPDNSKVLAKTADCPVAMYTVGNKFLGIQAHPEFSKDYNQAVYQMREDKIGKAKINDANDSLTKELSNEVFAHWIKEFLYH